MCLAIKLVSSRYRGPLGALQDDLDVLLRHADQNITSASRGLTRRSENVEQRHHRRSGAISHEAPPFARDDPIKT